MNTTAVHVAVFDTLADWEIGYATAHIRRDSWQREPGRYSIVTVGPSREPVTAMGGLRVTPDISLAELRPQDSAILILPGGDRWDQDSMAGFRAAARAILAAGLPDAAIFGAAYGLALVVLLDEVGHTSTAAWWQVLGPVLGPPLPVAGIAREMGLTRQSVQRIADILVERGLAEYRDNPAHRRAKLLVPTEAGRAAIGRIGPAHAEAAARL